MKRFFLGAVVVAGGLAATAPSFGVPCQTVTRTVPYQVCQTAHGQTRCRTFQRTVTRRICMYNGPATGPRVRDDLRGQGFRK